jgi:hypothetical protein
LTARAARLLATSFAITMIVGGCGGGGASSPSRAEFVKKANAACEKEHRGSLQRITAYLRRHGSEGKPAPELYAGMVRAVILPTIRAETKAIDALEAPAADAKRIEAFLAAQRAALAEVATVQRVASLEDVEDHFNKASDEMRTYGLMACANSPEPVDRRL